jgi:hypothetical protein
MEGNPIYKYLKENGQTDLDESAFVAKYSQPEEGAKLHGYLQSEGMTDLDQSAFLDKYFGVKKKGQPEPVEVYGEAKPAPPEPAGE